MKEETIQQQKQANKVFNRMNFTHKGDHQVGFDCLCQHPA
jgi:hypothetical protein